MSEKIATMEGITAVDGSLDAPMELYAEDGDLTIVISTEAGNSCVEFSLIELLGWLRAQRHTAVGEKIREFLGEYVEGDMGFRTGEHAE